MGARAGARFGLTISAVGRSIGDASQAGPIQQTKEALTLLLAFDDYGIMDVYDLMYFILGS